MNELKVKANDFIERIHNQGREIERLRKAIKDIACIVYESEQSDNQKIETIFKMTGEALKEKE